MTWQGRQLASAAKDGKSLKFTYDSEGIRTSKTVDGVKTEYFLNGTQILAEKTGNEKLFFFYDQQGNRVGMADGNNHFYYYIYNVQGDVIALADGQTGKLAATYTYDAWGKCTVTNATGFTVGTENPFRYRGYYYDQETQLYYLQSRYYDAETGRFINADAFATTNLYNALAVNVYTYCRNNPVMLYDQNGMYSFLCTEIGGNPHSAKYFTYDTGNSYSSKTHTEIKTSNNDSGNGSSTKPSTTHKREFVVDSTGDLLAFSAIMNAKISFDVFGTIGGCAFGIALLAAPAPCTQIVGVSIFFESLSFGGVSIAGDAATLLDGITKYRNNGVIYVSYEGPPEGIKQIAEWLVQGGIKVR